MSTYPETYPQTNLAHIEKTTILFIPFFLQLFLTIKIKKKQKIVGKHFFSPFMVFIL